MQKKNIKMQLKHIKMHLGMIPRMKKQGIIALAKELLEKINLQKNKSKTKIKKSEKKRIKMKRRRQGESRSEERGPKK